jgi:hypothetical protein
MLEVVPNHSDGCHQAVNQWSVIGAGTVSDGGRESGKKTDGANIGSWGVGSYRHGEIRPIIFRALNDQSDSSFSS